MKKRTQDRFLKLGIAFRYLIYALVIMLVFEGLLRKVLPPFLSTPVFFIKDVICLIGLCIFLSRKFDKAGKNLKNVWLFVFFLFVPLFIITSFHGLLITFFGAKQYLLYVIVGLLTVAGFTKDNGFQFKKFVNFFVLLLIPTTFIAVLQNSLPATHWLNLSVTGTSLEAFSAAGFLRVGSTFSFTGQYSYFLNVEAAFLMIHFFISPQEKNNPSLLNRLKIPINVLLTLCLIVGAFITGGRTAVLGVASCLVLGFVLLGFKRQKWMLSKGIVFAFCLIMGIAALRVVKPEYFAAYEQRSAGSDNKSHSEEIEGRVLSTFTNWTTWFWEQDLGSVILGNGLGVMSNGAEKISEYAYQVRLKMWTETDLSTTFWEGGLYLALVWYGFRLYIIYMAYKIWKRMHMVNYFSAASFLLAYIIINGITGTLALQPPLSIWWWMAVGAMITIKSLDRQLYLKNKSQTV